MSRRRGRDGGWFRRDEKEEGVHLRQGYGGQVKTCEIPDSRTLENRGMAWMIGAFVFCPCHLPITLAVLAFLLGGTAAGVALRAHPYVAAAIVTALWAAGTWRGLVLVKRAKTIADLRSRIAD